MWVHHEQLVRLMVGRLSLSYFKAVIDDAQDTRRNMRDRSVIVKRSIVVQ